jgi:hypothetical protein
VGLRFGPDGDLSAGYFHEHGTGTQEGRLNAALDWPLFERGTRPGLDLTIGGRVSFYTTGENYRDVHVRAAVGRGGPDTFEEIGLGLNDVGGHTPFLWDRVQVRAEVFGAKRIALGSFRLEGALRWDLDRSEIYDLQVAVARRYRCVEPEIRYSSRRESIMLGLKVFGIGADAEEDLPRVVAPPVESPPVSRSSGPVPVPGR